MTGEYGDNWDHVALDAEHRLVLSFVPGERTLAKSEQLVEDMKRRTNGRTDLLITSDEHKPYKTAIEKSYSRVVEQPKQNKRGRPPKPKREMPSDLVYGTVCKKYRAGKVVKVERKLVFGLALIAALALLSSQVSKLINTAFVERFNGTERGKNSRKVRKTYGFSKKCAIHESVSYFIAYSYNFCWPVRTLKVKSSDGKWQSRTPAMAAGLSDHIWSLDEWLMYPVKKA